MIPKHHVPEELLASYASGGVSEGESLLIATHAALCSACARSIAQLEALGGALIGAEGAQPVSEDLWARMEQRLRREPAPGPVVPRVEDPVLPGPLAQILGPYQRIVWKRALPGLQYVDLPLQHGKLPVRLRRFAPGMRIPLHAHRGQELELVLAGGAVDESSGQRFLRGDVAANDADVVHRLRIDPDGECLALGVQDDRVSPKGPWSRLVFGLLGW